MAKSVTRKAVTGRKPGQQAQPAATGANGKPIFPIVAVGGADGGIDAFKQVLQALPAGTGMACVFVQHLAPRLVSTLTQVLSRHSAMPVSEARQGLRVEPGRVYVIPAQAEMTIENGKLVLSPQGTQSGPRAPIDHFFRSLAADRGNCCIGVLLSGGATDGTRGILAIKAAGGITFAQESNSAAAPAMPGSAISTGAVDFVLSPEDIGRELVRLAEHPYVAGAALLDEEPADAQDAAAIVRILALVRTETGVDFSHYKQATIRRRIMRRMALSRMDNLDAYLQRLRSAPAELSVLHEDFLIHVTRFFRDPAAFEALHEHVFPNIVAGRDRSSPIRIWVPGCSSGEEVYSLAIALMEFLDKTAGRLSIQFFGTDISESALEKPRYGLYPQSISEDVSAERLRRFFTRTEGGYRITKQIREMCVFARHNVVQDPPFLRLDLISCRNVLIYLGPLLQRRAGPVFHYALKPDGFLLLGSSETVAPFGELFAPVDKKSRVYRRKAGVAHPGGRSGHAVDSATVRHSTADRGLDGGGTGAGGRPRGAGPLWAAGRDYRR